MRVLLYIVYICAVPFKINIIFFAKVSSEINSENLCVSTQKYVLVFKGAYS